MLAFARVSFAHRSRALACGVLSLCLCVVSVRFSGRCLAAAPAGEPDDSAAAFDRAEALYNEGRYEDAAAILSSLTLEFPEEAVLFYSLGRAYESAGQLGPAIEAYARYLELAGEAPDAAAIEARVGRLRQRLDAEEEDARESTQPPGPAVVPRDPEPPPTEPTQPKSRVYAPWIVAGAGALVVGAGGALAGLAASRNADARDEAVQATASDLRGEAENLALGANVSFAVGGVLVVAGVVWGVVELRSRRPGRVALNPGGVSVSF